MLWGSVFRDVEAAFGSPSSQSMQETAHLTFSRPLAPWLHPVPSSKGAAFIPNDVWLVWLLCLGGQVGKRFPGNVGGCGVEERGSWLQNPFSTGSYYLAADEECEMLCAGSKDNFYANSYGESLGLQARVCTRNHCGHSAADF